MSTSKPSREIDREEINPHRRRFFGMAGMTVAAAQLGMRRVRVVVPVLLRHGTRAPGLRAVPPRFQQTHLAAAFAEVGDVDTWT